MDDHTTPDPVVVVPSSTREAVANAISHEFAYDVGYGFVAQMADRLIVALAREGYEVVEKRHA